MGTAGGPGALPSAGVGMHAVFAVLGLVPPLVLVVLDRRGVLDRTGATVLGAASGLGAGAGLALGAVFQPTTANIHSGYSFRGVFEWLLLAGGGGLVGAAAGAFAGRWSTRWRPAVAVVLVVAVTGAVGWLVSGDRETIDCDDRPSFCEDRYGD